MSRRAINCLSTTPAGDYRLRLQFDDGTSQTIDFLPFLSHSRHPAIRAFLDPGRFASFRLEYGDLVWGDYDLCFPIMDLYLNRIAAPAADEAVTPCARTATLLGIIDRADGPADRITTAAASRPGASAMNPLSHIDHDDPYPESDGAPMAENTLHWRALDRAR